VTDVTRFAEILTHHAHEPWDADTSLGPEAAWKSVPGRLVDAIRSGVPSPAEVLSLLALAAAKRSLACWELYCAGDIPIRAVEAAERALCGGGPLPEERLEEPAESPFEDCRACDTGCAADAAAHLVRLVRGHDPVDCIYCLSAADMAFDQSPLGARDEFRRWLSEVVLPAAVERRPLTADEESALRQYSMDEIRDARRKG
jgi:hypothetical protein